MCFAVDIKHFYLMSIKMHKKYSVSAHYKYIYDEFLPIAIAK